MAGLSGDHIGDRGKPVYGGKVYIWIVVAAGDRGGFFSWVIGVIMINYYLLIILGGIRIMKKR